MAEPLHARRFGQPGSALRDSLRAQAILASKCRGTKTGFAAGYLYGSDRQTSSVTQAVVRRCREIWNERAGFLAQRGVALNADVEEGVRMDLFDLVILGADLDARLAPDSARHIPARGDSDA
jgi:hypothetical protein